jgi:2-oxoglutarate ferredoxin oxidoreductase subunit delta
LSYVHIASSAGCYFFIKVEIARIKIKLKGSDMKLWRKPFDIDEKTPAPVKVHIDIDRCKGCGYCAEFCPRGVLTMTDELGPRGYNMVKVGDSGQCLGCGLCQAICPEFGIYVTEEEKEEPATHAQG